MIHDVALMLDRERENREQSPSAAVIDSQSIKAPGGGKARVRCRQEGGRPQAPHRGRHRRQAADGEPHHRRHLRQRRRPKYRRGHPQALALAQHLFADGAYDRTRLMDAAAYRDFVLEIVRRTEKEPGFKVLPRRWVVERTFGWMARWKRLMRDYEQRVDISEAMIHVALGSLMLRRIVHP